MSKAPLCAAKASGKLIGMSSVHTVVRVENVTELGTLLILQNTNLFVCLLKKMVSVQVKLLSNLRGTFWSVAQVKLQLQP